MVTVSITLFVCGGVRPQSVLSPLGVAQQMPGLRQLSAHDQSALMKQGYFDLWLVSFSRACVCTCVCACVCVCVFACVRLCASV